MYFFEEETRVMPSIDFYIEVCYKSFVSEYNQLKTVELDTRTLLQKEIRES